MLRRIYPVIPFLLFSYCVKAQAKETNTDKPKIVFTEKAYDFGTLADGDEAVYEFRFFNKGNTAVTIKDISGNCSCIVAGSSDETIPPGGEGVITVEYKTSGRPGAFEKTVTVVSNAEPKVVTLFIKGMVY